MWEMNWLALIGAAVAGFALGGIWYGPLFGKAWQKESGLSDEAIQSGNMPMIFGATFVLNLVAAAMLDHVLASVGRPGLHTSALIGFGIGLGFVATSVGVNYLFSRKSLKLFWIDAGYWTVIYALMGAIFGLLR